MKRGVGVHVGVGEEADISLGGRDFFGTSRTLKNIRLIARVVQTL